MAGVLPSTSLAALPAVALDTETTGLDVATARLVQLGAVRMAGPALEPGDAFDRLVDPGTPIPVQSTAIHGIRDADVVGAPGAAEALPALADFIGDAVVIGYAVAFDLDIMQREARQAGITWRRPRALDVRLLARVALPTFAARDLDALCDHLGIAIEGRHTAIGDARAAAQIFAALVPQLRQQGIRTLAEAEAASRLIAERDSIAAGTPGSVANLTGDTEDTDALQRIDSYPYRRRVSDVMSAPPVMLRVDRPLRDAVYILIERGVSSVFVEDAEGGTGIVTERDVLRALHARGREALDTPLGEIRSMPLETVGANAMVYRAIGRMDRLGIRHLGVTDEHGCVVGAVTTRNLLRHRAATAMILGDEIAASASESELAGTWAKLPLMAQRLLEEEVDSRMIAGVISAEIRMLTRRAAELGVERMRAAGLGDPPGRYAVLVLGSAGRGESLLAADQDNAIVYQAGGSAASADDWFAGLGRHVADILNEVGIPYCEGGVMAKEPAWRKNVDDWKATIDHWVGRHQPEDLLNVDIFFDAVAVHGDRTLANAVWSYAYERGSQTATFWRALSETLHGWRSPLGPFRRFRTGRDGRVDLKMGALMPIFTAARVLSIKTGAKVRSTPERLRAATEAGLASPDQVEGLVEAHRIILGTMLRQQVADVAAGVRLGPRVDPGALDKAGRAALRSALRRVPGAIDLAREGMF